MFLSLYKPRCKDKYESKRLEKELEQIIFTNQNDAEKWIQEKNPTANQTIELIDAGKERFDDKYGILQNHYKYFKELDQLNNMLNNIKTTIKNKGLSLDTLQQIEVEYDKLTFPWVKQIFYDLFNYLQFEHSKSGIDNFPLLCCSDIIESIFGKFKAKAKQSVGGIYQSVLIIALSCNELTYTKIDEILTQTTMLKVKDWFYSMIGDSNLAKRKIAFANIT